MTRSPAEVMVELAERLEKATGPDMLLDFDIMRTVTPGLLGIIETTGDGRYKEWDDDANDWYEMEPTPFTASLDAAMTLVPEGGDFNLVTNKREGFVVAKIYGSGNGTSKAATPALALCAAALRARAAMDRTRIEKG